jgi:hypothetical protein
MDYGNPAMSYTTKPTQTSWSPITSTRTKYVTVTQGCKPESDDIITVVYKRQGTTSGQETAGAGGSQGKNNAGNNAGNISVIGGSNSATVEKTGTTHVINGVSSDNIDVITDGKGNSGDISSVPVTQSSDIDSSINVVTGNPGSADGSSIDVVSGSSSEDGQVADNPNEDITPLVVSDNSAEQESAAVAEDPSQSRPMITVIS